MAPAPKNTKISPVPKSFRDRISIFIVFLPDYLGSTLMILGTVHATPAKAGMGS
jgi:hypothetical protein